MKKILIAYHTCEGQSKHVAVRMADTLRKLGMAVDCIPVLEDPSPIGYSGVIAGDAIHWQKHSKELIQWLVAHHTDLKKVTGGLFQLSLYTAVPKYTDGADQQVKELSKKTGYEPTTVGKFGGRLAYPLYPLWKKILLILPAMGMGLSTDITKISDYTDWNAVDQFARDFFESLNLQSPFL